MQLWQLRSRRGEPHRKSRSAITAASTTKSKVHHVRGEPLVLVHEVPCLGSALAPPALIPPRGGVQAARHTGHDNEREHMKQRHLCPRPAEVVPVSPPPEDIPQKLLTIHIVLPKRVL
jgi:hypothetical protein